MEQTLAVNRSSTLSALAVAFSIAVIPAKATTQPLPEQYRDFNDIAVAQQCFYSLALQVMLRFQIQSNFGKEQLSDAQLTSLLELALGAEIWRSKFNRFDLERAQRVAQALHPANLKSTQEATNYCISRALDEYDALEQPLKQAKLRRASQLVLKAKDKKVFAE